jgi:DNA (cytosine-5)-methyltransferase 1
MKVFSTFTGIGGFELGIDNAADRSGAKVEYVGYSEIDQRCISVYEKHFKGVQNYGDITKIDAAALPDFDCLVGGFPCQAFSILGRGRGFEDTRGTLFFELARILQAKQPQYFVFENVKGLTLHDNKRTFRTIIKAIDELGYDCQWQVINSTNHSVPHNRDRIIIVGHLRGTRRPQIFPFSRATGKDNQQRDNSKARASQPQVRIPEATVAGYAMASPGQAVNLSMPNSRSRRGRVSDVSPTLDTGMWIYTVAPDGRLRRLTPTECERLQAFPDGWTATGMGGVQFTDRQRYKMLGNAVTTNVIESVFKHILK